MGNKLPQQKSSGFPHSVLCLQCLGAIGYKTLCTSSPAALIAKSSFLTNVVLKNG